VIKILIIGASGMIGNSLLRFLLLKNNCNIFATTRSSVPLNNLNKFNNFKLFSDINLDKTNDLLDIFNKVKPDVVINCAGIIKHSIEINNIFNVISLNSLLPHFLANLCSKYQARFIQISTDCVFSGLKGNYTEDDFADSVDLYGRSKLLGEVYYGNAITIRTSVIGDERDGSKNLLDWFLNQTNDVDGYRKAFFSGLTNLELASTIHDYVLTNKDMKGLYHLSSKSISKYDLLLLIKDIYKKNINIIPDDKKMIIDRSLNSSRFYKETGYVPKSWPLMIKEMKDFNLKNL
jgi:dTDP-4-dehydrorhamnose reductase